MCNSGMNGEVISRWMKLISLGKELRGSMYCGVKEFISRGIDPHEPQHLQGLMKINASCNKKQIMPLVNAIAIFLCSSDRMQ